MLKKYKCVLPSGKDEQTALVLGRPVTLVNGAIYTEGVTTKTYPTYFKLLKGFAETTKEEVKVETPVVEETKEEVVVETVDAGDVLIPEETVVAEAEEPKHTNNRLNRRRK